jgi:hypothetical protein
MAQEHLLFRFPNDEFPTTRSAGSRGWGRSYCCEGADYFCPSGSPCVINFGYIVDKMKIVPDYTLSGEVLMAPVDFTAAP